MAKNTLSPPGIIKQVGLYGYESVEWPILCGLVTGDPVLLVGGHGTAKTTLAERLARVLGLTFQAYDASKNLFEDVLGFPNPASLEQGGEMEYIATEISIWGKQFVLVDEISRANPAMQGKWLEIIRSHRVMGKSIEGLQYIFSAMNPPSYIGAFPLDEALAGRYAVVVEVPAVESRAVPIQREIIRNVTGDDARLARDGMRGAAPPFVEADLGKVRGRLRDLLEGARARLHDVPEEGDGISRQGLASYVLGMAAFCVGSQRNLDGRRMGMIWRNLMAGAALYAETHDGRLPEGDDLSRLLFLISRGSLPFMAVEEADPGNDLYRPAHRHGMAQMTSPRDRGMPPLPADVIAAARVYSRNAAELTPRQHTIYLRHFATCWETKKPHRRLRAAVALAMLGPVLTRPDLEMDPQTRHRLMELYRRATAIKYEVRDDYQFGRAISEVTEQTGFDADDPRAVLALRLTTATLTRVDNDYVHLDADHFGAIYAKARALLTEQQDGIDLEVSP